MSWGLSISPVAKADFLAALDALALPPDSWNKPDLVEQWNAQLQTAKTAIKAIVDGGTLIDDEGYLWSANLSGHAAHGEPAVGAGYTADEFISVSVASRPPAPVPAG